MRPIDRPSSVPVEHAQNDGIELDRRVKSRAREALDSAIVAVFGGRPGGLQRRRAGALAIPNGDGEIRFGSGGNDKMGQRAAYRSLWNARRDVDPQAQTRQQIIT